VPAMGTQWAEIGTRFMPHRDRGHIRKRYQVLQRRIPKGIAKMNMNYLQRAAPSQRRTPAPPPGTPGRARPQAASMRKPLPRKRSVRGGQKTGSASKAVRTKPQLVATPPPAPAVTLLAAAAASAPLAAPSSPPPLTVTTAGIFQHLVNASKRLPMSPIRNLPKLAPPLSPTKNAPALQGSPIKSSPIKPQPNPPRLAPASASSSSLQQFPRRVFQPFSKNHGSRALEAIVRSEVEKKNGLANKELSHTNGDNKFPSPETRGVAAVLGGFATSSRLDSSVAPGPEEDTRMGVENILGNNDNWSQASGMERLIEAGEAESNFLRDHRNGHELLPHSPARLSELPAYRMHDGEASGLSIIDGERRCLGPRGSRNGAPRKSILSSVMEKTNENARKRKSTTAFPSTPTRAPSGQGHVLPPPHTPGGFPLSIPPSAMPLHPSTPAKEEALVGLGAEGERSMNQEFLAYFMSSPDPNQSRQVATPGRSGTNMVHASDLALTPAKVGFSTPLSQFGRISGPCDGGNSLLMGASDFDAVAALKDLSNSAPNTPPKLLQPRHAPQRQLSPQEAAAVDDSAREKGAATCGPPPHAGYDKGKKPRTSFFGQVQAKMEQRNVDE